MTSFTWVCAKYEAFFKRRRLLEGSLTNIWPFREGALSVGVGGGYPRGHLFHVLR